MIHIPPTREVLATFDYAWRTNGCLYHLADLGFYDVPEDIMNITLSRN